MTRLIGLALTLLLYAMPAYSQALQEGVRGSYSGAVESVHPDWFKQSFLVFEEDVQEATAAGKRVLIYVYQNGCPYCDALINHNMAQRDIETKLRQHFDVIALNMWGDRSIESVTGQSFTEKTFARAIGVTYTPTLLFLSESGQVVLRLNGYVPPRQFRLALDYVAGHKEQEYSFQDYLASVQPPPGSGELRTERYFMTPPYRLAERVRETGPARPLLVLFEQQQCPDCEQFHEHVLGAAETRVLLEQFDVVQLDMWADTPLQTPSGEASTARQWARSLAIAYAPSLVLFDHQGQEVIRADAQFKRFHTQSILDYVISGAYHNEPEFQRYLQARAERLLEQGVNVDIWH